jgi:hypothetical protein
VAVPLVKASVLTAIKDLQGCSYNEFEAYTAYQDFSSDHIELTDFREDSCRRVTSGFTWCLFAIVWGIQLYDRRNLVNAAMDKFLSIN